MTLFLERLSRKRAAANDAPEMDSSQSVDKLIRAASEAQTRGDWAIAEALWKTATERRPGELNSWLQLGNMRNELGNHGVAIAAFQTAQGIDPEASESLMGIAGVHERAGNWNEALECWGKLVSLLDDPTRAPRLSDATWLRHALIHKTISASMAGEQELARNLLLDAIFRDPSLADHPTGLLLRARTIRWSSPRAALLLYRQCLDRTPEDDSVRFELGSLALDHGNATDLVEAAAVVEAALARRGSEISFLWLLADLQERLSDWPAVCVLSQQMANLSPDDPTYPRRAFRAALNMKDLVKARAFAIALLRISNDELLPLHELAQAYEVAGELDRARLVYRVLRRRWNHSSWHATRVIVLTAATRSLQEADRLLRKEIDVRGRNIELDTAYYQAAYSSGNYAEARLRLEWFLGQHAHKEDAQILLGYAIANTTGVADAERHFETIATRSFQSKDAVVGLAHMAMRKRDLYLTRERWANIVELYPDDTIARVEYARGTYEVREIDFALQICEGQLHRLWTDITMGEFYAWLLTAIGRFEDAWVCTKKLQLAAGANWALLETLLLSAAQTKRLDGEFEGILKLVPAGGGREDARRFYHAIRQLWIARRPDLLPRLLGRAQVPAHRLAWLAPYLRDGAADSRVDASFVAQIDKIWAEARLMVRADVVERIGAASDAEIDGFLNQPQHAFPTIHIVNKFEQARGGSELHALDLADRLAVHTKVELWAPEMPHPHFSEIHGVKAINSRPGQAPHGGVVVVIGVYFDIAKWISRARPKRVIFLYNTFEAPQLFERIYEVYSRTGVRAEILYCSDMMGHEVDLPGLFEPSPGDIEIFRPRATPFPAKHRFTIGRHSRDVVEKHEPEDWRVYQVGTDAGGRARLLGGTCMKSIFPKNDNIEFLPARPDRIVDFLQQLDCYYYNTSTWIEPWGRVVIEAMACGLPVLVTDTAGCAQTIDHGRNGLIFRNMAEAVDLMRNLVADADLRDRLGAEARRSVEKLLGAPALARLVSFYLVGA